MASPGSIDQIITSTDNNLTALNTILAPQWVSAPVLRGTSSILWSCLSTLIACVYTALHLNVPMDTSTWAMLKLKGLWVTIALIAPEVVVYMAISQLFAAWELKRGLAGLLGVYRAVDLEYCFFVVMGGVEVKNTHPSLSSYGRRRFITVSPEMMLWMARLDRNVPLEGKRIQDKSKADLLQKCLVLFQATWMAVQCITRRVLGLPLTVLEVHTMVHVLCATVMYAVWLKKPKDVREPERLDLDGLEAFAAVFSERALDLDHRKLCVIPERVGANNTVSPEVGLPFENEFDITLRGESDSRTNENKGSEQLRRSFRWNVSTFDQAGHLKKDEALPCGLANMGDEGLYLDRDLLAHWNRVLRVLHLAKESFGPQVLIDATGNDPRSEAMWLDSVLEQVPEPPLDDSNLRFPFRDVLLLDHSPLDRSIRNRESYIAMMLPAVYGGIHLAASSFDFPSVIESRLWLSAGLYIAIGLPIWEAMAWLMVIYGSTGVTDTLLSCLGCSNMGVHKRFWTSMRSVLGRVFLLLYMLARIYIIVESFISLRHVPIGVYLTPSWLQMIPHL